MKKRIKQNFGITMIEILVAVTIVALLVLFLLFLMSQQQFRAQDARRKADLETIRISFEDYYNDKDCYPPENALDNCGSEDLSPYLKSIPCDPLTHKPYVYAPESSCGGYKIYAALQDKSDPIIGVLKCDGINGCGVEGDGEYNYAISVGTSIFGPDYSAVASTPTPAPTVTPPIYVYACDALGECNQFSSGHPSLVDCPRTYLDTNCNNACTQIENRCP